MPEFDDQDELSTEELDEVAGGLDTNNGCNTVAGCGGSNSGCNFVAGCGTTNPE